MAAASLDDRTIQRARLWPAGGAARPEQYTPSEIAWSTPAQVTKAPATMAVPDAREPAMSSTGTSVARVAVAHVVLWGGYLLSSVVYANVPYVTAGFVQQVRTTPGQTVLAASVGLLPLILAALIVARTPVRGVVALVVGLADIALWVLVLEVDLGLGRFTDALVYIPVLVVWFVARGRSGGAMVLVVPGAGFAAVYFTLLEQRFSDALPAATYDHAFVSSVIFDLPVVLVFGALGLVAALIDRRRPSASAGVLPAEDPAAPRSDSWNVLAIVAFVAAFFVSVAAIVCGHVALAQIRRTGEQGRGLAIAALVLGYASLLIVVIAVITLLVAVGSASTVGSAASGFVAR